MTLMATTTDANLKTLLTTMLHYGAESQKFAGYKTAYLCNAGIGAATNVDIAGLTAPYTASPASFTGNAEILLDGALVYAIQVADGVTAVNYTCGGNSGTLEVKDGYVYFNVYAFRAADAIVLTAEGDTQSWTISLNRYLQVLNAEAPAEVAALAQAIANYTSAAAAYRAAK